MEQQTREAFKEDARQEVNYPALIRLAMRMKGVHKTAMLDAGVIKRSTWRNFDAKLDDGTISVSEFTKILRFLEIEPVGAVLTLECLPNVEDYFEPTCITAAHWAREFVISLTQAVAVVNGDFDPMKQTVCKTMAERQVAGLIQRNEAINEMRNRAFKIEGLS